MANNLDIKDGAGADKVIKTTDTAGVHTPHHNVDSIAAGDNNIGNVDVVTLPALPAGTNNIGDVDVLTVPADPFGATADAAVAAGATGSISAKLRRATQGLEDLKTLIVLAAGTNAIGKLAANSGVDIGDVDVTSISAGENHLGAVGGHSAVPSGTMTRPADTTAYAAGDGVTTATSGASALSVTGAARVSAGGGIIFGGRLTKSTTSTTNASFRGWIYQDAPTAIPNDNAAFTAAVHADYQKLIGTFTCDFAATGIVGSDGVQSPITLNRSNMAFKLASGTALTVILEARAAYTPGNAEIFRLTLDVSQD
jgi:hypothetical protein